MSYSRTRRIAALAGCLGASLAIAAPAQGAAVLTTGQLTGADGAAVSGAVRVYAWPRVTRAMELPLLGSATAAADGRFSVAASDDRALLRLARPYGGWLDFTAVADAAGRQGEWTFTGYVSDEAGVVRVVTPEDAAPAARVARVAGFAPPPAIGLKAARTVRTVARAAQTGRCENKREMTDAQVTHRMAVVGELNNAYNDGTWGRFTYGRGGSAETSIGVAASYGPGVWTISGTKTISDEGEAMFPLVRRRFARRLLSQFEFHKQSARNNTCAHWDTYISAAAWDGGNADRRQRGTLDKCDPDVVARWTTGAEFRRRKNAATRWSAGAEAWGINLTTQSGFSETVTTEYGFRGPRRKGHYICGSDGRESPYTAGRIFSGARK